MEAKVALYGEVEAGTRYTAKTAMERYPQLNIHSFTDLSSKIARRPKIGPGPGGRARDVVTYLAADVDALVARLATPEPEQVDPRWLAVKAGARYTMKTAMERHPQLYQKIFEGLPSKIATKPKGDAFGDRARDVKTYLAADVDALVARLAARPRNRSVDPRWHEVEAGTRHTYKTAMDLYPQLHRRSLDNLPSEIAVKPDLQQGARDVKTYLAADVNALVARLAAPEPEPVDPRWREVEAGARYDQRTALKRYPQLHPHLLADLPFEIARRPKIPKCPYAIDVKTYAAADVEALAASRAKKRARVQEPEPPQEPEPEQEEPEECPVCLDPMTGATATLVCGHLFCKDCSTDWASTQATCPTCRAPLQVAP